MATTQIQSALLVAHDAGEIPDAIYKCLSEAQSELEAAESLMLYQVAEGAWRGANWLVEVQPVKNNGSEEMMNKSAMTGLIDMERNIWLARIVAESHGPVEDFRRCSPALVKIFREASRAGSTAWAIRAWTEPRLAETHPEIIKAAEAVCDDAVTLKLEATVAICKINEQIELLVSKLFTESGVEQ
eukprot:gnl/MRDRNA2_/MRDRNA2_66221_c0_seq3.p1 gnl/MRDRNA2_/MRDRNA2_66221_c0~~gnl/MRDRNA2_/MRDRNA2_66221_c0_seq3.p1  ORF type:complete len:186 (+),score=27.30 gnl/MRDRNA2_/MRDRNA2_66221_c0_seq3:108-665(+)